MALHTDTKLFFIILKNKQSLEAIRGKKVFFECVDFGSFVRRIITDEYKHRGKLDESLRLNIIIFKFILGKIEKIDVRTTAGIMGNTDLLNVVKK